MAPGPARTNGSVGTAVTAARLMPATPALAGGAFAAQGRMPLAELRAAQAARDLGDEVLGVHRMDLLSVRRCAGRIDAIESATGGRDVIRSWLDVSETSPIG
ncbi:hypothetical protein Asp14428_18970 [Actinoplanes sp. NBRC 14428]|nr:hypothetical protein Asp14428_18970 [Actinoplanes sp. NBRC 14428]